jgi:hypothetical protein
LTSLLQPSLEFAFELRVAVDDAVRIGSGDRDDLHFTPITGGTVSGPGLQGTVVPGGGDWWTLRGRTVQLDAHYLVQAADGAMIDVVNRGYWRAAPEVEERLFAGGEVNEEELYYRTAFVFQTSAEEHRWLAESQFVGLARPEPGFVCIRVFRLR